MSLRFELGSADEPRGHAILYARLSGGGDHYVATYCVILPISFSLGKYLPPMFAGQLPLDALGSGADMSAMPIPPMLEEVESLDAVRLMAERRGDDLCDIGTLLITADSQRMAFAAEACAEYGQAYATYHARWPEASAAPPVRAEPPPVVQAADTEQVVASILPERDCLAELARLTGQARYALDGHDRHLLDEVGQRMRQLAVSLPEKYRAEQLVESALRDDRTSADLAELYLQRAFKLLDEDYISIPPIEQRIRDLRGPDGA